MKRTERMFLEADTITITWTCVGCGSVHETTGPDLETDGGCSGHRPDEYCYCSPMTMHVKTQCLQCHRKATVKLS